MKSELNMSIPKFIMKEMKPKGKVITPFNVIAGITIITAIVILFFRFKYGLGFLGNTSQDFPWGLLVNFNVITGVAFAGGAYVVTFMVYILGMEQYRPIVRPTVLFALLSYMFYAGALLLDLGRPWKIYNPIIGNSFGVSAILFLVAWHFMLYMGSLFTEFMPTITEWIGLKRLRKFFSSLTLAVVIFGIALSALHQSGVGALFLIDKPKIHPLWYSEFIPILFFVSSIFSGLSVVIILETVSQKVFRRQMSVVNKSAHKPVVISLAKVCASAMFVYFVLTALVFVHDKNYPYLNTPWGYWYLVEVIGFVLIPCVIFVLGHKNRNVLLVRIAAVMSVIGIILNRLNISTIAFKWYEHVVHFPSWKEVVVSLSVIFVQLLIFKWVARRMPVYSESPHWVHSLEYFKVKKIKNKEPWEAFVE